MTVFGPHYDAMHTGFAKQYCYYVKLSQAGVLSKRLNGCSLLLATAYPTLYCKTSLDCRRQTSATRSVAPIVLYTNVDAQCDKLATDDRRQLNNTFDGRHFYFCILIFIFNFITVFI